MASLQFVLAALVVVLGTSLVKWRHFMDMLASASTAARKTQLGDTYTEFDDYCYMLTPEEYADELSVTDKVNTDDDWDDDDDGEEQARFERHYDDDGMDDPHKPHFDKDDPHKVHKRHMGGFISLYESPGLGKPDWIRLGRCRHTYLSRFPPPQGYERHMDFFMQRDGTDGTPDWADRDRCFLYCLTQLEAHEVTTDLLVDAARMGLPRVTRLLLDTYGLNPIAKPTMGTPSYRRAGFNAVQEALRGGYAQVAHILSGGNLDLVIDARQRTVRDYLLMKGSPVRRKDALQYFGLDTTEAQKSVHLDLSAGDAYYRGWNSETKHPVDTRCDLPIVEDLDLQTFYYDFFMPGRPFVWKGAASAAELDQFARSRWEETETLHPEATYYVATQGEPALTNQTSCPEPFSIEMLEDGEICPSTGNTVFRSGGPPDYREAYPLFNGDPFHPDSVYGRNMEKIFGRKLKDSEPNHYFFFAGDEAGVTWHWHNAAFNTCFVGMKQWRLAPPTWRGFTALQSKEAEQLVPEDYLVRCTQTPGDMLYLPDFWGHMIVNAGFAVGTAMLSNQPLENMLTVPHPRQAPSFSAEQL